MIEAVGEPNPTEQAELHQRALEEQAEHRRRQDFAYLATLALLVLKGEATLGTPKPIGEHNGGGSYITTRVQLGKIDLPANHKLSISLPRIVVPYPTGEPRELAEALLTELTREA